MVIGAVILGSFAGILAGLFAIVGLGLPLWAGLLAWSACGTLVTLLPLVALALGREEDEPSDEGLAAA